MAYGAGALLGQVTRGSQVEETLVTRSANSRSRSLQIQHAEGLLRTHCGHSGALPHVNCECAPRFLATAACLQLSRDSVLGDPGQPISVGNLAEWSMVYPLCETRYVGTRKQPS